MKESLSRKQIAAERMSICKSCDKFGNSLPGLCDVCGWFMRVKVNILNEACPDDPPKWGKVEEE